MRYGIFFIRVLDRIIITEKASAVRTVPQCEYSKRESNWQRSNERKKKQGKIYRLQDHIYPWCNTVSRQQPGCILWKRRRMQQQLHQLPGRKVCTLMVKKCRHGVQTDNKKWMLMKKSSKLKAQKLHWCWLKEPNEFISSSEKSHRKSSLSALVSHTWWKKNHTHMIHTLWWHENNWTKHSDHDNINKSVSHIKDQTELRR